MAGPQFLTPRSAARSKITRRFTVAEATRALPLVKRVVGDIVKMHESAVDLQSQIEQSPAGKEHAEAQKSLNVAMDRLKDLVHELTDIGCELKDYQSGLIDFIGRHQGRDVCLCWKLGETKIAYWHELNGGFAGRKPISSLDER